MIIHDFLVDAGVHKSIISNGPQTNYYSIISGAFLTEHHAMKAYLGSGGTAPRTLDVDTRLRWMISFAYRPLY